MYPGVAHDDGLSRGRHRQQSQLDDGRHIGGLADMAEIGEEAVGNVDHGMRDAAQSGTDFSARIGHPEAADQIVAILGSEIRISPAQHVEPKEGIADRA